MPQTWPARFDGSRDRHRGRPHAQFVCEMVAQGILLNLDAHEIAQQYPRLALSVEQVEYLMAKLERTGTTVPGRHGVGGHIRKIQPRHIAWIEARLLVQGARQGVHSSTCQSNWSPFCHWIHPAYPTESARVEPNRGRV